MSPSQRLDLGQLVEQTTQILQISLASFLQKPFTVEALRTVLQEVLGEKK